MSTEVYVPRIYDLFHSQDAEDARFYRDLALASGGPVLELGVGTGRIALPIARSGVEIVGLDVAPEMLTHLQARLEQEPDEVRARLSHSEQSATWRLSEERDLGGGRFGLLSTASSFEPEHQQLRSWLRYEIYGADGLLEEETMHRIRLACLYPGDLRDVLREAGFTAVHIQGDFDGRPLSGDADEQVVRAR